MVAMEAPAPAAAAATAPAPSATPAAAPHAAHAPHVTIAAPPLTEAQRLAAEKEQKEKALQEKLDKRATIVATVLRKFVTSFYAGRQQMLDEARAAEAAKKARKGKKGKKGKKKEAGKEDKGKKDAKGGKSKKPTKTPVQEAWSSFMTDMDDRINKQKRVTLDDVFRGVAKLEAREANALAAVLATTTNKILPLDGLNLNQMNLREALFAASAAQQLPRDRAAPASGETPGLAQIQERGGSACQALSAGFRAPDLLRVGYPSHDVVAAAQHELSELRLGGVGVAGCVTAPGAPGLGARLREGARGCAELRAAGYTLPELMSAGLNNPWDLARAGFTMSDLHAVGFTPAELRAAGFGAPESQPAGFLGRTMATLMTDTDARALPLWQEGTQAVEWSSLLGRTTTSGAATNQAHSLQALGTTGGGGGSSNLKGGSGAMGVLRASHATVATRASPLGPASPAVTAA